jgi:hypothetical protein
MHKKSVHIDAVAKVNCLDGWRIEFKDNVSQIEVEHDGQAEKNNRLYFVNFGAAADGKLAELHQIGFFAAQDKAGVLKQAKSQMLVGEHDVHLDNLYDIDDCIDLSVLFKNCRLRLVEDFGTKENIEVINKYTKL